MKFFKFTFIFVSLLILSCNSTNKSIQEISKNETQTQRMITDGFKKGIVRASDDEVKCTYVIEMHYNDVTYYFDPIDLPERFKEDGVSIWFKYSLSRRMKRCEKANPIILNDSIYIRN